MNELESDRALRRIKHVLNTLLSLLFIGIFMLFVLFMTLDTCVETYPGLDDDFFNCMARWQG